MERSPITKKKPNNQILQQNNVFESSNEEAVHSPVTLVPHDLSPGWNGLGSGVVRKEMDLTPQERQFLLAVERGDIPSVQRMLHQQKVMTMMMTTTTTTMTMMIVSTVNLSHKVTFNPNCVDTLGRTALGISIEYDNIEMLDALLKAGLDLGDSLLQAINEDNVEATRLILNHEQKLSSSRNIKRSFSQPSSYSVRISVEFLVIFLCIINVINIIHAVFLQYCTHFIPDYDVIVIPVVF